MIIKKENKEKKISNFICKLYKTKQFTARRSNMYLNGDKASIREYKKEDFELKCNQNPIVIMDDYAKNKLSNESEKVPMIKNDESQKKFNEFNKKVEFLKKECKEFDDLLLELNKRTEKLKRENSIMKKSINALSHNMHFPMLLNQLIINIR